MLYADFKRKQMSNAVRLAEVEGYPCELVKSNGKNLKNYKIYGNTVQTKLPGDYTELEYIQSTGTQYIDTGFSPNQDTRVVAKFAVTQLEGNIPVFTARDYNRAFVNSISYWASISGGTGRSDYGSTVQVRTTLPELNTIYTLDKNKNITTIDNRIYTQTEEEFSTTHSILLFCAINSSQIIANFSNGLQIYSTEIYNNDVLVRNMVPAKRNSDNTIGMFDTVNNVFYTNAVTGTFIAGAEVQPTPEAPIPIYGLGERTRNLFNTDEMELGAFDQANGLPIEGISLQQRSKYKIYCKAGDSFVQFSSNTWNMRAYWYALDGTYVGTSALIPNVPAIAPTNTTYMKFNTGSSGIPAGQQLELGSVAHEYIPYHAIEVKSIGKNLFNNETMGKSSYIDISSLIAGKTYTFSCNIPVRWKVTYTAFEGIAVGINTPLTAQFTYTLTQEIINAGHLCLYLIEPYGHLSNFIELQVQIIEGSVLSDFEPYQEPQTTAIDLTGHEPLQDGDYIDYANSRIVRNKMVYVFDGTEKITIVGSGTSTWYYQVKSRYSTITYGALYWGIASSWYSNIVYIPTETPNSILKADNYYFRIHETVEDTVANFRQRLVDGYVNGNPLVWYGKLAAPVYEPIDLPPIPTVKDTCIITAQDKYLESTDIYAKYYKK